MKTFAIIGAGIAGLACANKLKANGVTATLFDKAKGAGGRLSTRRVTTGRGEIAFDIGATHFTVRGSAFAQCVGRWQKAGLATPWPAAGQDSWIGTPSMNAPVKAEAALHNVVWNTQIMGLVRSEQGWYLHSRHDRYGPFDGVILAVPGEQAAPLLSLHDLSMARQAVEARSHSVWTAMFAFDAPVRGLADFNRCGPPIIFATRGNARPGRSPVEHWTVQADWNWSEARIDMTSEQVAADLLCELQKAAGAPLPTMIFASAHRWLFAQPDGRDEGVLWNSHIKLGACGDWLTYGFVELAWNSGNTLGQTIADELTPGSIFYDRHKYQ